MKLTVFLALLFGTVQLSLAQPDRDRQALLRSFFGEWTSPRDDVRFYYSADVYFGMTSAQCSTSALRILALDPKTRTVIARIAAEKGEDAADFKLRIEPDGLTGWISNRTKFLAKAGALRGVSPGMRLDELPFTDPSPIRKRSALERPDRNDCQKR